MRDFQQEKLEQVTEAVNFYRGIVLDCVEQECGDRPSWLSLRGRLLKAFGDKGLANRVREILGFGTDSSSREGGLR